MIIIIQRSWHSHKCTNHKKRALERLKELWVAPGFRFIRNANKISAPK